MPPKGWKPSAETCKRISAAKLGVGHSDAFKRKMSKICSGKGNPMYGRTHTPEVRKRLSESRKGKHLSEETKKKLREAMLGEKGPMWGKRHSAATRQKMHDAKLGNSYSKGCKRSEETRKKQSIAKLGTKHSDETKKRMSETHKGSVHSAETKAKLSKAYSIEIVIATSKRQESKEERSMQACVRSLGLRFKPHFPLGNRYVGDICLTEHKIIIECDGEYWHERKAGKDDERDQFIASLGFRVIRIRNTAIRVGPAKALRAALSRVGFGSIVERRKM